MAKNRSQNYGIMNNEKSTNFDDKPICKRDYRQAGKICTIKITVKF
jgi:hypothetical protein